MPDRTLVLFAKEPRPGVVKSRLAGSVGEEEAAALYGCFVLDMVEMLSSLSGVGLLVAWDGPNHETETSREIGRICPGATVFSQRGADLGERLENAFGHTAEAGYRRIVALGSDSPSLPAERIRRALDMLSERDFVLGPAFDGGYYLIGGGCLKPGTLRGIAWSTHRALTDTVERLAASGFKIGLVEPWYDVDDVTGLRFLHSHLRALAATGQPIPCPRTFDRLESLAQGYGGQDAAA